MGLADRISRLERSRGPQRCPACGGGGGGPVGLRIPEPEVFGPSGIGRDDGRPRPEDYCPACGRKLVMRIPSPRLRGAAA